MIWEECIKLWNIGRMYHNASLEQVNNIFPQIGKLAETWLQQKSKPSLFLSGNPGSGKTYFMLALLRQLLTTHPHLWVLFITSVDLDNKLLEASIDHSERQTVELYSNVPILFVDDLGVERSNERTIKQYFSIIDNRVINYRPTVFTSNLSLDTISENLGDRIASRLNFFTEIKFPKRDLRKESKSQFNIFKESVL